jgi:hypothetical protein
VGLLGLGIGSPQSICVHRIHKHRNNANIHTQGGIRTHDPAVRAVELMTRGPFVIVRQFIVAINYESEEVYGQVERFTWEGTSVVDNTHS